MSGPGCSGQQVAPSAVTKWQIDALAAAHTTCLPNEIHVSGQTLVSSIQFDPASAEGVQTMMEEIPKYCPTSGGSTVVDPTNVCGAGAAWDPSANQCSCSYQAMMESCYQARGAFAWTCDRHAFDEFSSCPSTEQSQPTSRRLRENNATPQTIILSAVTPTVSPSAQSIEDWLRKVNPRFVQYAKAFVDVGCEDTEMLADLDDEDQAIIFSALDQIGLKKLHKSKISRAIRDFA